MSNLTINDRNSLERAATAGSAERIRRGSERGAAVYSVVAALIAAALCFAAISVIDGWSQWVVLGAIVATTVGFMITISPARRG
jgi:hypothetical protein